MCANFGFGALPTQPMPHRDDLLAAADHRAERDRSRPLVTGQIVVRRFCRRRALERGALDAELRGKSMQLADVIGEEMTPLETGPFPDRRVDVHRHGSGLELQRSCLLNL